jgi:hypothetical protein
MRNHGGEQENGKQESLCSGWILQAQPPKKHYKANIGITRASIISPHVFDLPNFVRLPRRG